MLLEIHELIDTVPTRESGNYTRFVFANTTRKIIGDTNVKGAIALARQDVNVESIAQDIEPLRDVYPGSRIVARAKRSLVRDTDAYADAGAGVLLFSRSRISLPVLKNGTDFWVTET